MADGDVQFSQAEVIVDSVKDLTPGIDPELRAEGEQALIGACGSLDPAKLGQLGRRPEELLDPDGVQGRDEAKILDHEARAFGKREFTLSPDPYGSGGLIRGRYDAAGYAVLTAALTPCPRHSPQDQMVRRTNAHPPSGVTTRSSRSAAGSCTTRPRPAGMVGRPRSGSPSPCTP